MRSSRYRLRFYTGASLSSATYGGGNYGDATYGMTATDTLTTAHHRLVPWPAGALVGPSWRYRQNDTMPPWEAQIIADDGVVDLTGVAKAYLVLTSVDDPTPQGIVGWQVSIITAPNGDDRLHHDWLPGELVVPGVFRATAVLEYVSGRRLTVPTDDRHTFVVHPDGS